MDDDDRISRVLALQHDDGNWGVGVYDGDDWDSTMDALWLLRELEAPVTDPAVAAAVERVDRLVRWEERNGGRPFFQGETEACVNGRVAALGACFDRPDPALIDRLLGEQLPDGGWNCEAPTSARGSFHSTICVLEGLLAFERAVGGSAEVAATRTRGEEYLLERRLLRSLSSGRLLDEAWVTPHAPVYWCYDVLRALDHLRLAGREPDDRVEEAVAALRSTRRPDGTWPVATHPGRAVIELERDGGPSRLITDRARRVLVWAEGPTRA